MEAHAYALLTGAALAVADRATRVDSLMEEDVFPQISHEFAHIDESPPAYSQCVSSTPIITYFADYAYMNISPKGGGGAKMGPCLARHTDVLQLDAAMDPDEFVRICIDRSAQLFKWKPESMAGVQIAVGLRVGRDTVPVGYHNVYAVLSLIEAKKGEVKLFVGASRETKAEGGLMQRVKIRMLRIGRRLRGDEVVF